MKCNKEVHRAAKKALKDKEFMSSVNSLKDGHTLIILAKMFSQEGVFTLATMYSGWVLATGGVDAFEKL